MNVFMACKGPILLETRAMARQDQLELDDCHAAVKVFHRYLLFALSSGPHPSLASVASPARIAAVQTSGPVPSVPRNFLIPPSGGQVSPDFVMS